MLTCSIMKWILHLLLRLLVLGHFARQLIDPEQIKVLNTSHQEHS